MNRDSPRNDDSAEEEIDLSFPLRTVCYIAERVHDLMGRTASTDAEDAPDDDDPEADILEDRGHDPVEEELTSLIDDLDEDTQVDLVALDVVYSRARGLEHTARTGMAGADIDPGLVLVGDTIACGLPNFRAGSSGVRLRKLGAVKTGRH